MSQKTWRSLGTRLGLLLAAAIFGTLAHLASAAGTAAAVIVGMWGVPFLLAAMTPQLWWGWLAYAAALPTWLLDEHGMKARQDWERHQEAQRPRRRDRERGG